MYPLLKHYIWFTYNDYILRYHNDKIVKIIPRFPFLYIASDYKNILFREIIRTLNNVILDIEKIVI